MPQCALEAFELAEGAVWIPAPRGSGDQLEVGALVGGIGVDELFPASQEAQQVPVKIPEPVAGTFGPRLVRILGQQVTRVEVGCGRRGRRILLRDRRARGGLEGRRIHVDIDIGKERDGVAGKHHGTGPESAPRVVRGLVQPRTGLVDGKVGPETVENLLAVQGTTPGECQQLDDGGGLPATPHSARHGGAIDHHGKAAEQRHACAHCPVASRLRW